MTQVNMIPFGIKATIEYPKEIMEFLENFNIISSDKDVLIEEKSTGNTVNLDFVKTFNGRKELFVRTSNEYLSFSYLNGYNQQSARNILIDYINVDKIISLKPKQIDENDRFIYIISFNQAKIVNSISEAFNDQVLAIEECSILDIENVIRDIMINNEFMTQFNFSDVKFDIYSHNHEVKNLSGLCTVSGQEVWFTIRCFSCN